MRNLSSALAILAACAVACGDSSKITVSGKLSPPVSGAQVIIGRQAATADAATGAFSIGGVTPPYDLVAIVPGATQKAGVVYKGLRRPDPTIRTFAAAPALRSATISGTVTGGLVPPLPLTQTHVSFGAPDVSSGADGHVGATITYELKPEWSSGSSITGTLHALQWNPGNGCTASYTGYAEKAGVTIADGGSFAGQDLAMTPVAATHVTGTLWVPAGLGPNVDASVGLVYADRSWVTLFHDTVAAAPFDCLVPSIAGATAQLVASASLPSQAAAMVARVNVPLDATGVTLALQAAPEAIAPDDAATGVTNSTVFSWQPFANGVHVALFGGGAAQPAFYVVTTEASTTIPDLSLQGLELPKNASYQWMVEAFAPNASVDEAADARSLMIGEVAPTGDTTFHMGLSQTRSFQTAP